MSKEKIMTWEEESAPSFARWNACRGDYDLGKTVGTGATKVLAIADLLQWEGGVDDGDSE